MRTRAWLLDERPGSRRQARLGRLFRAWLAFRASRAGMAGLGIVAAITLVAALADVIAPWDPTLGGDLRTERLLAPSPTHPMGTDELARDVLGRIVHGARTTLSMVAVVALVAVPVGLLVGVVAGYVGGVVDTVLMRLTDVVLAFPRLILALALVAALGPGTANAVLAIAITAWPPHARLARAEAAALRGAAHIDAIRLEGASTPRILLGHVLPSCWPSVLVRATLDLAAVVLVAAGLGFLGLGVQPPSPEWGAMVAAGRHLLIDHAWVATAPGLAILLLSLGFNLLGDGLRDVLDPATRR